MSMAQNKQLISKSPNSCIKKFLKFCYFIPSFLMCACGNGKSETATQNVQAKEDSAQTEQIPVATNKIKTILCFGDSITAGYGLDDTNDAFPALLQQKIDSLGVNYTVINSGLSGETSAGGKSRIDWILKQDIAIFVLELGANDGLRGVALSETRSNLQFIIDVVQQKSEDTTIVLAGMELPPNMGQAYTKEFRQIYAVLAQENQLEFIPFILKDVGGIASLNQSDGIHPTVKGHQIVANTVWEVLKPLVKE
ncbi:arylesterase [Psychroserpens burtonensis]|uniref:Arylesterase n=1 Tax=Psychroserpens burtonensis TaxID=49278 RepID=A0A5C7BE84_9FLAO|nr:arylesterase [Psychroserpens burtonensis]TXE20358.1 arylesterase [Psychroserpens burtonensis]